MPIWPGACSTAARLRDDLKILVMSPRSTRGGVAPAVQCAIISSEGRSYPVDVITCARSGRASARYRGAGDPACARRARSDVLAFLPGAWRFAAPEQLEAASGTVTSTSIAVRRPAWNSRSAPSDQAAHRARKVCWPRPCRNQPDYRRRARGVDSGYARVRSSIRRAACRAS